MTRRTTAGMIMIAALCSTSCGSSVDNNRPSTTARQTFATLPNGEEDKFGVGDTAAVVAVGEGVEYMARLLAVVPSASGSLTGRTTPKGDRLMAVKIQIQNQDRLNLTERPVANLRAEDAAGRSYAAAIATRIDTGPLLDPVIRPTPASPATGWVVIPVPLSARITHVYWAAGAGQGGEVAWHV